MPTNDREMVLAMYTIKSIAMDLFRGGIDTALYALYTTNRWTRVIQFDMASHLVEVFRVLIYRPMDLCMRSNNYVSIFDKSCDWWVAPTNLAEDTIRLMSVLRSKHYNAFIKMSERSGIGGYVTWTDFKYRHLIDNMFLTLEKRAQTKGVSRPCMSMRAIFCERMLYVILSTNFAYTRRVPEQASEVWSDTVAAIKCALLRLTVDNYVHGTYEPSREELLNVEPSESQKDTPHSIYKHINRMLEDENRLFQCTMEFLASQYNIQSDSATSASAAVSAPPATATIQYSSAVEEVVD